MRKWIFKALTACMLLFSGEVINAQTSDAGWRLVDSRTPADYTGWSRLIPTHIKGQYAGGFGVASLGCGWDYGEKNRWETDLMCGFLPKCYSDQNRWIFAVKQLYIPWQVDLFKRFSFSPLTCGFSASIITGKGFWFTDPDRYIDRTGDTYYRFPSRARAQLAFGQRITWHRNRTDGLLRSISLFYEWSICDLNLISKVTNQTLDFSDLFYFSCGLRFHVFRP